MTHPSPECQVWKVPQASSYPEHSFSDGEAMSSSYLMPMAWDDAWLIVGNVVTGVIFKDKIRQKIFSQPQSKFSVKLFI
jgi:hypothetical protein